MNHEGSALARTISRRSMLHMLSVGGAGMVALAGQLPVWAMQAPGAADSSALTPLNRFPRMVQELDRKSVV